MQRYPALFIGIAIVLAACGGSGREPTPTAAALDTSDQGAGCAPALRNEFVRQQTLVLWDVYCPSTVPEGFELATAGADTIRSAYLGDNATPTTDMLGPGGGTFITRLIDPAGRAIVIVQGAGASIYNRRDETVRPGGFEDAAGKATFGGIEGTLFDNDPAAVIAFDRSYGHMVMVHGLTVDELRSLAASMRPVGDASALAPALLGEDAVDDAIVTPRFPDGTLEDPMHPYVCLDRPEPGARLASAAVHVTGPRSGPFEDSGFLPPLLQHAVLRFAPGEAAAYMTGLRATFVACPARWTPFERDPTFATLAPLPFPSLGDESIAFRRSVRSLVQGSDSDAVAVRNGDLVAVLISYRQPAPGEETPADYALPFAKQVAQKLAALAVR